MPAGVGRDLHCSEAVERKKIMNDHRSQSMRGISRRRFFRNASVASFTVALQSRFDRVLAEESAAAHQNLIIGGDHPDASPIRVGDDFYLTH